MEIFLNVLYFIQFQFTNDIYIFWQFKFTNAFYIFLHHSAYKMLSRRLM
jgi:hypothetical protein